MSETQDRMTDPFPAVQLLVRHGKSIALLVGVLPFALLVAMTAAGAISPGPVGLVLTGAAAIVIGAVLHILLRSYVEIATILADMMIPR